MADPREDASESGVQDEGFDGSVEIGYEEDGVVWITASNDCPDAAAAEQHLGRPWQVVAAVWLAPTGEMVNHKDAEWSECPATTPKARPGWRRAIPGCCGRA